MIRREHLLEWRADIGGVMIAVCIIAGFANLRAVLGFLRDMAGWFA